MKKFLSLAIILVFLTPLTGFAPAYAQDQIFYLGNENPEMYVELRVENLDKPGQPISVGQRFRVKGSCVVNISKIYEKRYRTENEQIITDKNDPLNWGASCNVIIWYGNYKQAFLFDEENVSFKVTSTTPVSIPFFDEVAKADKSEFISATGGGELFGNGFSYTAKNGQIYEDWVDLSRGFKEKILFTPLAKPKSNQNQSIVELDGDEESDEEPLLVVKKESSNSYLISVLNHLSNHQIRIKASKKSNKTYSFTAKTDSDGDITIRAKRNLKGYKIELIENGKSIVTSVITS
jgi:hypothetical protein